MLLIASYSCNPNLSIVLPVKPAHSYHYHYSKVPTDNTFRHDAVRESAPTINDIPITNHAKQQVHGHQDARAATGTVTFYNGLFTQQFIASGTVYTGQDGVAIVTTQDATIPEGSPSTGYGTVTIAAQAVTAGTSGNIQAGNISITINNGLLVRNNQFSGGQDERTYTTVTQHDIHSISTMLTTTLEKSIHGALQGQLTPNEQLHLLPCTPTVTSDHQPGDEATIVKVTVSATCSAIAYNSQELQTKATAYLATQAQTQSRSRIQFVWNSTGYSHPGKCYQHNTPPCVLIVPSNGNMDIWHFHSIPTADQTSHCRQNHPASTATLLAALPGVESAAIRFSGFGDDTRIPKQPDIFT